jgi:hypothetical protein
MARNKSILAAFVLLTLVSWGASSSRLGSLARGLLLTHPALSSLQFAGTSYARQVELSQEAQPR